MPEIVGQAAIRIRAITTDLSKEIKAGVEKGAAEADLSKASKTIGTELGGHASTEVKKGVVGGVEDAAKDSSLDTHGKTAGKTIRQGIEKGLTPDGQKGIFSKLLSSIFGSGGGGDSTTSGKREGENFFKGFNKALNEGIKAIPTLPTGGILKFGGIAAAAPLVTNVITSLIGQIGFLGQSLLGVGAAGAGAFGAIAISALPLFLALKTASPQLDAFKVRATAVADSFKSIGLTTQQVLLPALGDALERFKVLIPAFQSLGKTVGLATKDFVTFLSRSITAGKGLERMGIITDNAGIIFRQFLQILVRVGDIASALFVAVLPIASRLLDDIEKSVTRLQDSINFKESFGSLQDIFDHLYDSARLLFGALGDITAGLITVLRLGGDTSLPLFESFREFAKSFRDFTNTDAGRVKIIEVFQNAHKITSALFGVLSEVVKVLFQGTIGGADTTAGIVGGLNAVRDAIPKIAEGIGSVFSRLSGPLSDLAKAVGDVFHAFDQVGGLALIVESLARSLEILAKVATLPGFAELIAGLGTIVGVLAVLKTLGIIPVIEGIAKGIGALAGFLIEGPGLAAAFDAAGGGFAGLAAVLPPIALAIGIVAGSIAAAIIVFKNWDTITAAVADTFDFLQKKFSEFVDFVSSGDALKAVQENFNKAFGLIQDGLKSALSTDGLDSVTNFASKGTQVGQDFMLGLLDAVKDLPGQLAGAIGSGLSGLGDILKGPLQSINDALGGVGIDKISGILTNLGELFTSVGKTASVFADIFKGLVQGSLISLAAIIDGVILPAIRGLSSIIADDVIPAVVALAGFFNDFLRSPIATFIRDSLTGAFEALGGAVQVVSKVFETIMDLLRGDFSGALSSLGDVVAGIVDIFKGLGTALLTAPLKLVKDVAGEIGSSILRFLGDQIAKVGDLLASLGSIIGDAVGKIPGLVVDALKGSGKALLTIVGVLKDFFLKLPGRLVDTILKLGPEIAGILVDALVYAAEFAIGAVLVAFLGLPALIVVAVVKLGPILVNAFKAAFNFLVKAIPAAFSAVLGLFEDLLASIGDLLGKGAAIAVEAIPAAFSAVVDFFKSLPGTLGNLFGQGAAALVNAISSVVSKVAEFFTPERILKGLDNIGTFITNAFQSGLDFISSIPDKLVALGIQISGIASTMGKGIFDGIVGFVEDIPGAMLDAIKGAAQTVINIVNSLLSFLHDHLRVDIDDPTGLTGGVHFGFPDVQIPNLVTSAPPELLHSGANALGGIFDKATLGIFGEAGREAIIPLTRPRRAAQLARQSGLTDLLQRQGELVPGVARTGAPLVGVMNNFTVDPNESAALNVRRLAALSSLSGV